MLPPTRVQIKRKATDDPVEILRVHDELARGRNAGQFIFKRQRIVQSSRPNAFTPSGLTGACDGPQRPPEVKTSQPGDELRDQSRQNWGDTKSAVPPDPPHATMRQNVVGPVQPTSQTVTPDVVQVPRAIAEPRRFHLSRKSAHSAAQNNNEGMNARRTAGKSSIALFSERKATPAGTTELRTDTQPQKLPDPYGAENGIRAASQEPSRELGKKPSVSLLRLTPVNAVKPRRNSPAPLRGARLPSGDIIPWNASAERLNMEMQAYTLKEIRKNLADNDEPLITTPRKPTPETVGRASPASRFKPRATAGLRYHERHPEAVTNAGGETNNVDVQAMDLDDDDSNYIIETYIRMPVEQAMLESNQASIGLLILDSQPDIDEFYNGDSDSDSDEYDEEEDENAENHPSTDYPDEEVQSDDEYGINPYQYRNRNASDNEEYDEDDARFSDDELEAKKEPWSRRPWMQAYSGKNQGDEDEDDEMY